MDKKTWRYHHAVHTLYNHDLRKRLSSYHLGRIHVSINPIQITDNHQAFLVYICRSRSTGNKTLPRSGGWYSPADKSPPQVIIWLIRSLVDSALIFFYTGTESAKLPMKILNQPSRINQIITWSGDLSAGEHHPSYM